MSSSIDRQIEEIRRRHLAKKRAAAARRLACDSMAADIALFRSKRRSRLQARLDSASDSAERKRLRRAIRRDADGEDETWITVHPNGGTGVPIKIEEATGEVVGGAGGAMNGTVLSEAESQPLSELQNSSSEKSESGSSSSSGSSSTSGGSIAASANLTSKMTSGLDELLEAKTENRMLGVDKYIQKTVYQNLCDLPRGTVISVYNSETGETDLYEAKGGPYHLDFVSSSGKEYDTTELTEKIRDTLSSTDEIKVYDKENADVVMGRKTQEEQQAYKNQQKEKKENIIKAYEGLSDDRKIDNLGKGSVVISADGQVWMKTREAAEMIYSDYVEEYGEPDDWEDYYEDDTVYVDSEYVNLATGESREVPYGQEIKNQIMGTQVRVYRTYEGSDDVVEGDDLSDTYETVGDNTKTGTYEIENVLKQQGFDGLPRVVSPEEFVDAVKSGGVTVITGEGGEETICNFVAQRIYCAQSQEELDSYENDFYNGKFYVSCEVGGHTEGRGMYCAASYSGVLNDRIDGQMKMYERLGAEKQLMQTVSEYNKSNGASDELMVACAMRSSGENDTAYFEDQYERHGASAFESRFGFGYSCVEAYNEFAGTASQKEKDSLMREAEEVVSEVESAFKNYSKVETLTLDPSATLITLDEIQEMKRYDRNPEYASDDFDVGTYAAIQGYDGICAYRNGGQSGGRTSYTVILNRTKLIVLGGSETEKSAAISALKDEKYLYKKFSEGAENTDSSDKTTKRKRRRKNMSGNITFEYNQKTGMLDSYKDGKKIGSVYASCGADPEDRMAAKKLRKDRKTGRSRKNRK